jgi:hypothetical protein
MKIMTSILDVAFRILQGLLTPVIACIAVYIAYRQHITNRDRLRLDLYNKRYKIYDSLKTLLGHIAQQQNVTHEQVRVFLVETKEAVFLFGDDIETYLDAVRGKALNLWAADTKSKSLSIKADDRIAEIEKAREIYNCLLKESNAAVEKFSKYLKFEQSLKAKPVNLKRGVNRIALVLSALWFLFWSVVGISEICDYGWESDTWIIFPFIFLSPIVVWLTVWMVYYTGLFIVRGFRDDKR